LLTCDRSASRRKHGGITAIRDRISAGTIVLRIRWRCVGDVANGQEAEVITMKLGRLSALSSAALLAAGVSLAMAQSSPSPSSPSGSMNQPGAAQSSKCWDSASQTIKDKAPGQAAGGAPQGGATTGAAPSGSTSPGAGQAQRPAAAAGLPNC
jgi:hypothetical protein